MGAQYSGVSGREMSHHSLKFLKGDLSKAVEILGDIISNTTVNESALEVTREKVRTIQENTHNEYERTLLENVHFNVFREHMMGQPSRGDIDNLNHLSAEDVHNFYTENYFGDNIVIVGTGDVSHSELVDLAETHFSSIPKSSNAVPANTEQLVYNPALLMVRDDEMVNSNVGVFYDAPGLTHPDYYGFQLLKEIFGQYNLQDNAEHLNDVMKQYNAMHVMLGELPDVTRQSAHHLAYSDGGVFGNYFFGNEVFTRQMTYAGMAMTTIYGTYMNDVEVFRARNRMYNNLMRKTGIFKSMNDIASQIMFQGRRTPRSEIAKRVAHMDAYHMKHLCYEWFYDSEPSITAWGPIESISATGSYKYFKQHTMSTVTNAHHGLYW